MSVQVCGCGCTYLCTRVEELFNRLDALSGLRGQLSPRQRVWITQPSTIATSTAAAAAAARCVRDLDLSAAVVASAGTGHDLDVV
jgi:hypothetical protein